MATTSDGIAFGEAETFPRSRDEEIREHELKVWPEYFQPLRDGDKTFEVRKDDRGFSVGDTLWLREYDQESGYTGRETHMRITYILRLYQPAGWVILAVQR